MNRFLIILALLLAGQYSQALASAAERYSVVKVEVQSGVPVYSPSSLNRTVARVRLKQGTSPEISVWFEIDDAVGYGKIKLGMFTAAVTSARQVEISTDTGHGWINWAIDNTWTDSVSAYCYLVGVTQ